MIVIIKTPTNYWASVYVPGTILITLSYLFINPSNNVWVTFSILQIRKSKHTEVK